MHTGHRISVDIDLFSDEAYGSIDFNALEHFLKNNFSYVVPFSNLPPGLGTSYAIGKDKENSIKLDIYYTDSFIQPAFIEDTLRLATVEEIIAMKMDVIQRGGRKKDFWDLHEMLSSYTISAMLKLHEQRYPFTHNKALILQNLTNFEKAEDDFEPICLKGKFWEFIKEDIKTAVNFLVD